MSNEKTSWQQVAELITAKNSAALLEYIDTLSPSETARTISRLPEETRLQLFTLLSPEDAADVIEDIPEAQAADLVEEMPSNQAAAIMEELDSDHLVDVLGEMDEDTSRAILAEMDQEEAREARMLLEYDSDCAGGLMISEFLSYTSDKTIQDVLDDMQANREEYGGYHVQYFYVVDRKGKLSGILQMHDLLFPSRKTPLSQIMISSPLSVSDKASLAELEDFFEEHHFFGVPVVDEEKRLVGVVLPGAIEEAVNKRKTKNFLNLSGIVGGEEFRTMPLLTRSGRRLSWLSVNIVLNIMAASVIAMYQDTLAAVITLAVFLPMVSDMSGCSGNQAVAVSMRELSLGLVRPGEILWVLAKEARVGIINGAVLGVLLGSIAYFWKGNAWLGLVVGGALAANTLVSVTLGGMLPLLLKRLKLDPALVSSPLLTTVTDMCGFFFVLSFAAAVLPKLGGM
ncbi:Mg2+ transporter MgtE [Desulfocapsa sulfexigens DSM 10523]|uniref:Magnesium transporter MgtE n=1 Tax=Desulfocapsa sulfexigens (strain DSM 10523 / SB164P1) TaxID=1167006 RepID=M1P0T7_DESSD|nr:magnesium transporter [Desulfocapsa sulfexigens]AGF77133.1 Mg2+ transporter MgtE [Desulfocapsa sulfexigens DSM 10523]